MLKREVLPTRRVATRLKLLFTEGEEKMSIYAAYSLFPDGRVAEVFLTAKKQGTLFGNSLNDAATAISISLQCGVSFDLICSAILRKEDKISPASPVGLALEAILESARDEAKARNLCPSPGTIKE